MKLLFDPSSIIFCQIAQLNSFKERQAHKRDEQDRRDQHLLQSIGAQDTWQYKAKDLRDLKVRKATKAILTGCIEI